MLSVQSVQVAAGSRYGGDESVPGKALKDEYETVTRSPASHALNLRRRHRGIGTGKRRQSSAVESRGDSGQRNLQVHATILAYRYSTSGGWRLAGTRPFARSGCG